MAKPMDRDLEYVGRAEKMTWKGLRKLWAAIQADATPGWDGGKAFEHLVVRAFKLSGLEAEYPYDVPPGGKPLEQIDGLVHLDGFAFLIECKDKEAVDIEAIAKLRNQLLRRPETTLGCVFTSGEFTAPALTLADFALPHRILLWPESDIARCLIDQDFRTTLREKYRHLCKYGLTDLSPYYKDFEET
jgi:hypothetical protein